MIMAKRLAATALAATLLVSLPAAKAPAQSAVNVVVNGAAVSFDQPPVERAGRVFVPLRGVFERLGASVVYANGDINAQGNGRGVHLHIGSTAATVNGQTLYMDVAPFLIGARTLVPLRFVAQALGAAVNWDASSNTVYINGNGVPSTVVTPVPGGQGNPATNVINRLSPAANSQVSGSFTLSGHTRAGSTVHIVAQSTTAALGGIFQVPRGNYAIDTTADANGNFSVPISLDVVSGGSVRVQLTSTSPNGVTITRTVAYST
jgi:hypothetical protein